MRTLLLLLFTIGPLGASVQAAAPGQGDRSLELELTRIQDTHNLDMPPSAIIDRRRWMAASCEASIEAYILARQALLEEQTVKAMGLLTDAIRMDQGNAAAWRQLALLRERDNQFEQGHKAWVEVLRINPRDMDALRTLGLTASMQGNMNDAARMLLAWRLAQGHRVKDQLHPFGNLRADAALAESLEALGESVAAKLLRQGARESVVAISRGSAGFFPQPEQWLNVAGTLHQHRAYENAFDVIETIVLQPDLREDSRSELLELAIGMAVLFDDGQRIARLLGVVQDRGQLTLVPSAPPEHRLAMALFEVAAIFSSLGNQRGAAWLYEDVLELDPQRTMALNNLGYYNLEQGIVDASVQRMLKTAFRQAPKDSAVLDSYGWLQYLHGRFEDNPAGPGAMSLLTAADEAAGLVSSPEILEHLGDVQWRLGQPEAALASWTEAIGTLEDPEFRRAALENSQQLQQMLWGIWGRRIRHAGAVYDLQFSALLERLKDKRAAIETGETPPVRATLSEEQRRSGNK